MERRDRVDTAGALALIAFSALLGFNQVVIRVVNEGLQPMFFAGVRSLGSALLVWGYLAVRRRPVRVRPGTLGPGLLIGLVFSAEFVCLFLALDLTTVVRSSVIFYSMPLWLALAGHFLLPDEPITRVKAAGLALAFAGVAVAIFIRGGGGEGSPAGDVFALLAAFGWAGVALCARATPLRDVPAEEQLLWQLGVSAPVLLLVALFFGPFVRDLAPIHLWGLGFQIVVVSFAAFLFWFMLLKVYPAASVAAFGFLAPIFGVFLGWWLLDEPIGPSILVALLLVAAGLVLINRPATST